MPGLGRLGPGICGSPDHGARFRGRPGKPVKPGHDEIAIKLDLGRDDFKADPRLLRRKLLANGYRELAVTGEHAVAVASLPPLRNDPFDRMLVAQSVVEGIMLLPSIQEWHSTRPRYGGYKRGKAEPMALRFRAVDGSSTSPPKPPSRPTS